MCIYECVCVSVCVESKEEVISHVETVVNKKGKLPGL